MTTLTEDLLAARWYAQPRPSDPSRWCVATGDSETSAAPVATGPLMTREVAEHIAAAHNALIDGALATQPIDPEAFASIRPIVEAQVGAHLAEQGLGVAKAIKQIPVRVGQVWADNDRRSEGRKVQVVAIDLTHATVEPADLRGRSALGHEAQQKAQPGRQTRIRLDRFRPTSTGYQLVSDVEGAK